jgi:hypothetical protein
VVHPSQQLLCAKWLLAEGGTKGLQLVGRESK